MVQLNMYVHRLGDRLFPSRLFHIRSVLYFLRCICSKMAFTVYESKHSKKLFPFLMHYQSANDLDLVGSTCVILMCASVNFSGLISRKTYKRNVLCDTHPAMSILSISTTCKKPFIFISLPLEMTYSIVVYTTPTKCTFLVTLRSLYYLLSLCRISFTVVAVMT